MKQLTTIALTLLLTACNGILEDIYDKPSDYVPEGLHYGYQSIDPDSCGGVIYVNATSYTRWTYFNLRSLTSDTIDFASRSTADEVADMERRLSDWDFAVHRSVPKTNRGEVAETPLTSLEGVGGVDIQTLEFAGDTWSDDMIATDLSSMFTGDIVYLPSYYNATLNRWLDVGMAVMPPTYTPSHRVYVLRLASGDLYALRLAHFRSAKNITGWLTIEFRKL